MSSKRMRIIILGMILFVTLACGPDLELPDADYELTRTAYPVDPTPAPPKTPYYKTTMGSYTTNLKSDFFTPDTQTYTCSGQDAVIKMVIYLESGRVQMWAFIPNISIWGDCSVIDNGVIASEFAGSLQTDGSRTYVRWDWCDIPGGQASSTAVREGVINLLHLEDFPRNYDEVFIGGATCSGGGDTDGFIWDFSFTLTYQHEFSEADTGPR